MIHSPNRLLGLEAESLTITIQMRGNPYFSLRVVRSRPFTKEAAFEDERRKGQIEESQKERELREE